MRLKRRRLIQMLSYGDGKVFDNVGSNRLSQQLQFFNVNSVF